MISAENKKKLKRIAWVSMPFAILQLPSLLGIPFGLIFWLFNPIGWKIALSGLIAFPFLTIITLSFTKQIEKFKAEHEDDE